MPISIIQAVTLAIESGDDSKMKLILQLSSDKYSGYYFVKIPFWAYWEMGLEDARNLRRV